MKRLGLTTDSRLAYCEENQECEHIAHQDNGESIKQFIDRISADSYLMTQKENIFIAKRMLVDNIYRSAKLEGISITFAQTEDIVENNGCGNLRPNDVNDIINLKRGWQFLLENLDRELDLALIKDVHGIIGHGMESVDWREIGEFRKVNVGIGGTLWRPEIPDTETLYRQLCEITANADIVDRSLEIYLWACRAQMFKDGNKRVATLIANFELVKNGHGLLSVPENMLTKFKSLLVRYYETGDSYEIKEWLLNYCYFTDQSYLDFSSHAIIGIKT